MTLRRLLPLVAATLLAAGACSDDSTEPATGSDTQDPTAETTEALDDEAAVGARLVFSEDPTRAVVPAGDSQVQIETDGAGVEFAMVIEAPDGESVSYQVGHLGEDGEGGTGSDGIDRWAFVLFDDPPGTITVELSASAPATIHLLAVRPVGPDELAGSTWYGTGEVTFNPDRTVSASGDSYWTRWDMADDGELTIEVDDSTTYTYRGPARLAERPDGTTMLLHLGSTADNPNASTQWSALSDDPADCSVHCSGSDTGGP